MEKSWGIARFYGWGSMEYLLESGVWLPDRKLYDGAPIKLFETLAVAESYASQFPSEAQPHGVQFSVDAKGQVVTWKPAPRATEKRKQC